jgi:hypothetical protein
MPTVDMYTIITIDICIVSILPLIKIFRLNLEMFRQCGIFVYVDIKFNAQDAFPQKSSSGTPF